MWEVALLPVLVLASLPCAALVPGVVFSLLCVRRRDRLAGARRAAVMGTAALWLLYGAYEARMYFWMKTVVAPIRVDLLLIVPVLYLATAAGTIALCGTQPRRRKTP